MRIHLLGTSLLLAFLTAPSFAGPPPTGDASKGPNEGEKGEGQTASTEVGLESTTVAAQLAEWGRDNNSAEALVAAAQLLATTSPSPSGASKTTEAGSGVAESKAESAQPSLDPKVLLADAAALAKTKGQTQLASHIAGIQLTSTRAAVGGPKYTVERVLAYSTDSYTVMFRGGESARVCLSGDGDTDLDLYVYDEYGNSIESGLSYGDDECVSWYPKWTGPFTIRVKNRGKVYNQYVLLTN